MESARRNFLRGKFLTHEGRDEFKQESTPLGFLPPWHIGKIQKTDCTGCDQPCVSSCDQEIIKIHPQGHDTTRTISLLNFPNFDTAMTKRKAAESK